MRIQLISVPLETSNLHQQQHHHNTWYIYSTYRNWKPPISDELEYITSKVDSVAEPSEMMFGKQLVLSPLHTPQSSYSPTQSSIPSQTESPSSSLHGRSTHPPVSNSRA